MACNACCKHYSLSQSQWRNHVNCYLAMGILMGLIQIGLGVLIFVYNDYANTFFGITDSKVQSMTYVNGCSDLYTKVDSTKYAQIIAD